MQPRGEAPALLPALAFPAIVPPAVAKVYIVTFRTHDDRRPSKPALTGSVVVKNGAQWNLSALLTIRMPVILRPEDEAQWLDVSRTSFAKAQSLLKPLPAELIEAHGVSPIVNSAKYDGPECIQPVSDDELPHAGQLSLL